MTEKLSKEAINSRKPEYEIHPIIIGRWSPRAMAGEEISDEELMPLFEAARWAPSSYNNQPWRFIYAKRNTEHWKKFMDLMVEFNQSWTKNAAVLIVVISQKIFEYNGKPSRTHNFDAGAAWENLAIEGASRGFVVHGMEGFDYDKARNVLGIPDDYDVECMIAVGVKGKKEDLPKELQDKEVPSTRKPLKEIVMEGGFRK